MAGAETSFPAAREDGSNVSPADQPGPALLGPVAENTWERHKETIRTLYIDQGMSLNKVMDTMSREYHFHASAMMYKKKFRQWKFKTNRKGWGKRAVAAAPKPLVAVDPTRLWSIQQVPVHIELPAGLRLQEVALREMCDVLSERLRPLTLSNPPPLVMPRCFTEFHQGVFSGSELALTGKAATVGAILSRAFAQIEPMLKSDYPFDFVYYQAAMLGAKYYGRPELMDMVLNQLNRMATKIYGRNHATALWTRCVLSMPGATRGDAIEWFSKAGINASVTTLGSARDHALFVRVRGMMVQLYNNPDATRLVEEWERVVREVQDDDDLHLQAMFFYSHSMREIKEHKKAVEISKGYNDRLKDVKGEDGLSVKTLWTLLGFNQTYSQALASLKDDEEAEKAFKLGINKALELLGEEHPTVFAARGNYAVFLKSRGRPPEEIEKADEEFEKVVKGDVLKPEE